MDSIILEAALVAFFALVALWLMLPASPKMDSTILEQAHRHLPARV
ncbi:MAG: hypothetical protein IT305_23445 [Chloroflexi bacterium]|nr:hypothetical protein [Chloroflexota bacterium]